MSGPGLFLFFELCQFVWHVVFCFSNLSTSLVLALFSRGCCWCWPGTRHPISASCEKASEELRRSHVGILVGFVFWVVSFRLNFKFCHLIFSTSLVLARFSRQCCWSWLCARLPSSPSGPNLGTVTSLCSSQCTPLKLRWPLKWKIKPTRWKKNH